MSTREGNIDDYPDYKESVENMTEEISAQVKRLFAEGYTPDEVYIFLRDEVDLLTKSDVFQEKMTCGKTNSDCSFCCHETILIGKIESQYLMRVIREKEIKPNMERVVEQMTNPDIKWMQKACPLLLEPNAEGKRLCSIYEDRPLICRTHNSNEEPAKCDRSTDPRKIIKETRASAIDALQMVSVLVGLNPQKPYSSIHELMFHMFNDGENRDRILEEERLRCTVCKKPHGLTDEDAGSPREMMRVCESCLRVIRKENKDN